MRLLTPCSQPVTEVDMQRVHITEYHQRGAARFERVDSSPGRFYEDVSPATLISTEIVAWVAILLCVVWCFAAAGAVP